ncbi:MAG: hypothetical protein IPI51_07015 [Betaproteobacteria bacterium]|nr:hypothetical protein [Betaproteobacteria bacterium]
MRNLFKPIVRSWAYRVALAVCVLLSVKGLIDNQEVLYWNLLFAALFGMADAHITPPSENDNQNI